MKLVLKPVKFIAAQSMGADFTAALPSTLQVDLVGIQLNYTGSPVGVIEVQGSLDNVNFSSLYLNVNGNPATNIAIPTNTSPIAIDLYGSAMPYLRIKYTRTSGTGSMDGFVTYKRLGD
jgi:hypothetical protein